MGQLKSAEMKYEHNWKEKSLENLEKDQWTEPDYGSYLVTTCYNLRKKPIKNFGIEDLIIMIGQNIGLKFLIPFAFEKLNENILAEGDFYMGDLLHSILTCDKSFWSSRPDLYLELCSIVKENFEQLKESLPQLIGELEDFRNKID